MTRRRLVVPAIIGLAPVLIVAEPRPGNHVTWLVPAACIPFPGLLADNWPTRSSLFTIAAFVLALGLVWVLVFRSGLLGGSRGVPALGILSLVGPALVVTSLVLISTGSGILSLVWSGAAAIAWALFLLFLTPRVTARSQPTLWALRCWLAGEVLIGGCAAVYGVLVGLCC